MRPERGGGLPPDGLKVSFVESLADMVEPVIEYLVSSSPADIFQPETIIVPNAGVRSWLLQHIAGNLGTGPRGGDGVAANIDVRYLGHLDTLLGRGDPAEDPWAVGPLAVGILSVLARSHSAFVSHADKLGGGLKAARALADRFDRYQARRPSMIRQWAAGNPVLAPEVGESVAGEPSAPVLSPADMWQFELWREVHALIGRDPWPVAVRDMADRIAAGAAPELLPPRLMVAGMQSLSVRHLEALNVLSSAVDITVVMVHPSPSLAAAWSGRFGDTPLTPGVAPGLPAADVVEEGRSPLVASWLRGARDAQLVLASQGIGASLPPAAPHRSDTLLGRLHSTIATDSVICAAHESHDRSVQIHRAHNLGRQVEILRDALLHAFREVPNLEPHEVVVLCADVAEAAPLLEAAFAKSYDGGESTVRMPLVVADRALREVDDSASLLVAVLEAARSRFSVDHVMSVATNPLVLSHHEVSSDTVGTWQRLAEATAVRWGASAEHRARVGVVLADYDAHTWSAAINRALLGAVLPDAAPAPDAGGVVPLVDVESADVEAITVLSRIVTVLADLEREASLGERSLGEWADLVQGTLEMLASDARGELDAALSAVDTIRSYALDAGEPAGSTPAGFDHVADLIIEQVSGAPGRQPLRTGAITATSLVPLRGVPFRVVCLVGFDDGTVPSGDLDGDDLIGRQSFAGDPDARLEYRRAILDAVCAASERVIVTCNGFNIKTNAKVQFITPLAEFVDLCVECGARWERDSHGDAKVSVEHLHPRHFTSRANFVDGEVVDSCVWSHDSVALDACRGISTAPRRPRRRRRPHAVPAPSPSLEGEVLTVTPVDLRRFLENTLHPFVRTSLGINTWVDSADEPEALVPLTVPKRTVRTLSEQLFRATRVGAGSDEWFSMQTGTGAIPPGVYGAQIRRTLMNRLASLQSLAGDWGVDASEPTTWSVDVSAEGVRLRGDLALYGADEGRVADINFGSPGAGDITVACAINLLLLRAAGFEGEMVSLAGHETDRDKFAARHVELARSVGAAQARKRVVDLLALYRRAMGVPYPLFGGAAMLLDDHEAAEFEFSVSLGGDSYVTSLECLVYGALPVFDEVYRPLGEHEKFFGQLAKAQPVRDDELRDSAGGKTIQGPHRQRGAANVFRYVFS